MDRTEQPATQHAAAGETAAGALDLASATAFSFDCYGTLIDWEAGLAGVLAPWAHRRGAELDDAALLLAYADHEAAVEREHPTWRYPLVLAEAFRRTGETLGLEVSDEDAEAMGRSVPDWPAFPDSHDALRRLQAHAELIILSNVDRESFAGSRARLDIDFDEVLTAEEIRRDGSSARTPAG